MSVSNGWIVTNAHVVWPFRSVSVRFPGEKPTSVTVAHVDLTADLALLGPVREVPALDISPRDLPAVGSSVKVWADKDGAFIFAANE